MRQRETSSRPLFVYKYIYKQKSFILDKSKWFACNKNKLLKTLQY